MHISIKIGKAPVSGLIAALSLILSAATFAADNINILACEPEWASLAEELGGGHVKAFSATHAKQNPHFIRARPSLISKARRADMIMCSGAGLEAGWLPILIQKGSSRIQPGKPGYFLAADFVPILEIPTVLDRSLGDIHPEGNPHVHLNPHNILIIANEFTKRLIRIDSNNQASYTALNEAFTSKWKAAIEKWEQDLSDYKNLSMVIYHKNFSYLIDWLGINLLGSIEVKPGIPPTAAHLEELLGVIRNSNSTPLIAVTPYDATKGAEWLSGKINKPYVTLPYTVGGDEQSKNLFDLFDRTLALLK